MRARSLLYIIIFLIFQIPSYAEEGLIKTYGISLTNSLKYSKDFTRFSYVNPLAKKQGSLRLASIGSFDSLNPFILKGTNATGVSFIYDTLMYQSQDEIASSYGLIAESLEYPLDKSFVIFNLRDIAKWHDGSDITADDVVFTFNILTKEGHPIYRMLYRDVDKVEALSTKRVKFSFKRNDNRELIFLLGSLSILPKKYYLNNKFNQTSLIPPLGSGPYRIKEIRAPSFISYDRVPNYWGKDLPVNKGRYNFGEISYNYYLDDSIAIQAFKSGAFDLREENIAKNWYTAYENFDKITSGEVIKKEIKNQIPAPMQAFVMNTRRLPFDNRMFRKALEFCFDFEWTNKTMFFDSYKRTSSFFQNSIFASRDLPVGRERQLLLKYKEEVPSEIFTEIFALPDNHDRSFRNNLLEASRILKDNGFVLKNGKLVDSRSNKPIVIEFLLDNPGFKRVILPIIGNLRKLGIEGKIKLVDSSQYQKRIESFDYDIVIGIFSSGLLPGNELINYWHSSKVNERGGGNLTGAHSKVIDELIEDIARAKTIDDIVIKTRALDRILLFNYYVIPNWYLDTFRLIYWDKLKKPDISPKYGLDLNSWWSDR